MNGNYSMNTPHPPTQFQVGHFLSWFATGIVAFSCTLLAPIFIRVIPIYANMFQGLGVELPWPTRFLLATYYWLLPIFFITLTVFVIWKECSARELRPKFQLTARVFFGALFAVGLVILALYLPMLTLASKLVDAK
jgi:type II secretory pathway component PulF